MAITQAGKQFTADQLQQTAGNLAAMILSAVQQGGNLRTQLESWPDADLVELGLSQEEINALKGFFVGDLPAIAAQLSASVWLKQLVGVGV